MNDRPLVRPGAGGNTIFDIWVDGKLRLVAVTREAIEDHLRLPPEAAAEFGPQHRVKFVQNNLHAIIAAAKLNLHNSEPDTHVITIRSGNIDVGLVTCP